MRPSMLSKGHCNRSQSRSLPKTHKRQPRNMRYIQYVVNFRTIWKTDRKAFLSTACLGEEKSFYDISLRLKWHSLPNCMKLQRIILSSENILSENL